ncbi:MAG TPA: GNAT family N-acetyltransferase [Anaerolineae bacterium]|nr:GNAT family N-acetyltransferase [Anaerolineae bacterium]HOQ98314.1 GNAT family N-acetyltransferase [Anaerolineae bacterium]HPL28875.1 GNAT family N-acetyltransferase [Anaerolineae bacterium]
MAPDAVTIRPYQPGDLESCRALWAALVQRHRQLYGDPSIGGDAPGVYFDQHLARIGAGRIWVAERGEVMGLVGLIVEGEEAEVEPIAVAAGERGRGIGRLLLERAIAEAHTIGVRFLNVRPVARNAEAIAFFHEAGFRLLGRIELFMDLRDGAQGAWRPGADLFGHRFGC